MTTTTKKEGKGTQGVNASQTKAATPASAKPANGTTVPAKTGTVAIPLHKPTGKPQSIEEQMKFFDGLASLVSIKRRFEAHREAILELHVSDEELAKFGAEKRTVAKILLIDESDNEYAITNPLLVQETQEYLVTTLDRRIDECDRKIMAYAS